MRMFFQNLVSYEHKQKVFMNIYCPFPNKTVLLGETTRGVPTRGIPCPSVTCGGAPHPSLTFVVLVFVLPIFVPRFCSAVTFLCLHLSTAVPTRFSSSFLFHSFCFHSVLFCHFLFQDDLFSLTLAWRSPHYYN